MISLSHSSQSAIIHLVVTLPPVFLDSLHSISDKKRQFLVLSLTDEHQLLTILNRKLSRYLTDGQGEAITTVDHSFLSIYSAEVNCVE